LGAVHIPYSGENYTIINIEPKNVKMAMVSNDVLCILIQSTSTVSSHILGIVFSTSSVHK
jgi:hypothetical protein